MKTLLLLTLLLSLAACEAKIDASSEGTMKSSIEEMKQDMSPDEKAKFEEAVEYVVVREIDSGTTLFAAHDFDTSDLSDKILARLDGMTADQVIAEANRIREERRLQEIAQIKAEISELEQEVSEMLSAKQQSEAARNQLENIKISNTELYWASTHLAGV